jgi:membrane associated rhomboid family serine protease
MFVAIPVAMNYRTERLPLVTFSLIGLNTLIWVVSTICLVSTGGDSELWIHDHLWLVPASCSWYAPLTSMFVHAGFMHLLGNMLYLFLFGSCVEDMIGRRRFTVFYLAGGLIAEIVYIAMTPGHFASTIPMGGASGAISTCLGMYLLLRAAADIEFKYFLWLFVYVRAGEFEIPAWVAITFWFGEDVLFAVLGLRSGNSREGVAFGAHVGGFLGGLVMIWIYHWLARPRAEVSGTEDRLIDPAAVRAAREPVARGSAIGEVPTIFLHDGQQQTGPFTLTAVQAMLQRGEISRDASYWSEGLTEWQSVVDLAAQPM